ncbi:hypothetical protein ACFE04_019660 [Oxalis oulophora]
MEMFRPTRKRHVLKRWGLGLLIRKDEMELLLSLRGAESPKIDLIPPIESVLEPRTSRKRKRCRIRPLIRWPKEASKESYSKEKAYSYSTFKLLIELFSYIRLLFLVLIRKESSTVKGFLDWYYWLVHLLGFGSGSASAAASAGQNTRPGLSFLRFPILQWQANRRFPSFGYRLSRLIGKIFYCQRKKKLSNPDILGTVPAEKDPDFPESAFPVRCNQQLKAIKGRSCRTGVLSLSPHLSFPSFLKGRKRSPFSDGSEQVMVEVLLSSVQPGSKSCHRSLELSSLVNERRRALKIDLSRSRSDLSASDVRNEMRKCQSSRDRSSMRRNVSIDPSETASTTIATLIYPTPT